MEPKKPAETGPRDAWRYESLGYTFAFSIVLFAGAGYLLDRWIDTAPLLTIAGTLVGAGLAVAWVFTKVRQDERARQAERTGKKGAGAP
jgi:F0F1-type ATP synthase assembly protein I